MQDKTRRDDPNFVQLGKTDWAALDAKTDEEIEAAALSDPDNQPWPKGKPMRRAALAKRIRFKYVLGQEEFAERYQIPLTTLKAWERHEAEPDAVALAYLNAILADPEGVANAVAKSREQVTPNPKAAE
jgi:putative transcriptional regulator